MRSASICKVIGTWLQSWSAAPRALRIPAGRNRHRQRGQPRPDLTKPERREEERSQGSLGVGHSLSQHPFELPHSLCPLFLLVPGGGQERLRDHLVVSSWPHAPDDCGLIIGSGLGPAPEAKDSGLVSSHFFSQQLRNTKLLQLQTAQGCSEYWTSSLEMAVLGF